MKQPITLPYTEFAFFVSPCSFSKVSNVLVHADIFAQWDMNQQDGDFVILDGMTMLRMDEKKFKLERTHTSEVRHDLHR